MHIKASFIVIKYVTRYYANQIHSKKRLSQQLFEALPMTVYSAEVTMVLMSRDQSFAISWKTQAGPAPV